MLDHCFSLIHSNKFQYHIPDTWDDQFKRLGENLKFREEFRSLIREEIGALRTQLNLFKIRAGSTKCLSRPNAIGFKPKANPIN